jgi:homoserine trans-succinylase
VIALVGSLLMNALSSDVNGFEIMEVEDAIAQPIQAEVCAIVTAMPGAEDTDGMLALLGSDPLQVIRDLEATAANI